MSEAFINRAYDRVVDLRKLAAKAATPGIEKALSDAASLIEAAIDVVECDGTLPASLCAAVVKYGRERP